MHNHAGVLSLNLDVRPTRAPGRFRRASCGASPAVAHPLGRRELYESLRRRRAAAQIAARHALAAAAGD